MFNLKNIFILAVIILIMQNLSFARPINEVYGGVSEGQMIYYSFLTKNHSGKDGGIKSCVGKLGCVKIFF